MSVCWCLPPLSDSQILKHIQLPNAVEYRCGLNYYQIEHMDCSWGKTHAFFYFGTKMSLTFRCAEIIYN